MKKREKWEAALILAILKEIHRSRESRYDHRLHALLLVAQGMLCSTAARYLGDAPRTIQHWTRLYQAQGFKGIKEGGRPGRPRRLKPENMKLINAALETSPQESGLSSRKWNGKALREFIQSRLQVSISIRQCQRLIKRFENRSRRK